MCDGGWVRVPDVPPQDDMGAARARAAQLDLGAARQWKADRSAPGNGVTRVGLVCSAHVERPTSVALKAALDAAKKGGATEEERAAMSDESGWSIEGWVSGIEGKDRETKLVAQMVADAVQLPLGKDLSETPQAELAFIKRPSTGDPPIRILSEGNTF